MQPIDQQLEPLPKEIRKMLNVDTLNKLGKKLSRPSIHTNEIDEEFKELSDAQLPKYGQGMKYRRTKAEIKASRYE